MLRSSSKSPYDAWDRRLFESISTADRERVRLGNGSFVTTEMLMRSTELTYLSSEEGVEMDER